MISLGEDPEGATPLSPEDLSGLRPSWVSTQAELNRAEAANILAARAWVARTRKAPRWYLQRGGPEELHRRMFGDVWKWAGRLRTRETNIGIDPHRIGTALEDLREDVQVQIGDGTNLAYPVDELVIRFHHRLVLIHPFANGNGRHARLAADLLAIDLGQKPFSWGGSELGSPTDLRAEYLHALRHADRHDEVDPLISFARRPSGPPV